MSAHVVAWGPRTRNVYVGTDVVGLAVFDETLGCWTFREPRFRRFRVLEDGRWDSRAEMGTAVAEAAARHGGGSGATGR